MAGTGLLKNGAARPSAAAITAALAFATWLLSPPAAIAAESVGKVVATEGKLELSSDGTSWRAIGVGAEVALGDTIRTGRPGRARILFRDDSTINVAEDSVFTIDENVYAPEESSFRSVMQLLRGKVRAVVGEGYDNSRSSYQIQTATAVSGVRGTEFIVTYDAIAEATDVVTLSGRVEVRGTVDLDAPGVLVDAGEITSVPRGARAGAPRQLGDDELQRYMLGVDFVGGGRMESMLLQGRALENAPAAGDQAGTIPQSIDDATNPRETPGDIVDQPPPVLEELGGAIIDF